MTSQPPHSPTVEKTREPPLPPPPGAGVEAARPASIFRGLSDIMKEDEERRKKVVVALRALTLLFSFLSFIIMATNTTNYYLNGVQVNFTIYEPFSYVLAIAIIVMVYSGAQTGIKIHQLRTGKELMAPLCTTLVDFIGDQIMAYLLISSASAATPQVTTLKAIMWVHKFTDQSAAAVSMSYLAFFCLAPAALFSGFSLSMQLAR